MYKDGIRFECQGSGKCCTSHGEFGEVYLTKDDRKNMAKALNLTTTAFTKKFCNNLDGTFALKQEPGNPDCIFLKDKKCGVYKGRPTQCRTWPFWPDVMNAKAWKKDVVSFCPGIGKGKLHSPEFIESELNKELSAEKEIFG